MWLFKQLRAPLDGAGDDFLVVLFVTRQPPEQYGPTVLSGWVLGKRIEKDIPVGS